MPHSRLLLTILSFLLAGPAALAADTLAPSFAKDVRPLLEAKCVRCHGGKVKKADLDLSTPAAVLKGGESGPAVVPGKPDKSPLYERVHKGEMPPAKKDALAAAEVETLRRWIADGAKVPVGSAEIALTQHDVIPIMLRHCTACHGRHKQDAGLDLRTPAAMLRGGKSGPAIVPGKPEVSLVVTRIAAGQMPPAAMLVEACVKPVEKAELDTLTQWIADGAPVVNVQPDVATTTPDPLVTDKDRDFWAFRPPVRPQLPKTTTRNREPDRRVRPREAGCEGADLRAAGGSGDAPAPRLLRPHRAAAGAGGGEGVPRGQRAGRLRKADRPAARLAPLRRAVGPVLARPRGLRRLRGQARAGPAAPARLAVPRLRHPQLQRRQAVRPLPAGTARGRRTRRLRDAPRRSRRNCTTTSWRPASSAWRRTRRGRTSPASSRTASR